MISSDRDVNPIPNPLEECVERDLRSAESAHNNDPNTPSELVSESGVHYDVISLLGQGTMGSVYKVCSAKNMVMAAKILRTEFVKDATLVKRFEQEVHAASSLTHPNLAAVYDHGLTDCGAPFFVMDYIEGLSLAQLAKRGRLDPKRAIEICIQATDALSHAHKQGIIHRDIKPSNIMVSAPENTIDFIKLVDFGIAKLLPAADENFNRITHTAQIIGSPEYMSPEQCNGETVDARSDIYSLGCVLYELVTGAPPFAATSPVQTVLKQINELPQSLTTRNCDCKNAKDLNTIVQKALAKDANHRYQSVDKLRLDLLRVAHGKPPASIVRKRTLTITVLALLLFAFVAGALAVIKEKAIRSQLVHYYVSRPTMRDQPAGRLSEIKDIHGHVLFHSVTAEDSFHLVEEALSKNVRLYEANLSGQKLERPWNSDQAGLRFDHKDLAGAVFVGSFLYRANFTDCDLRGANFSGCQMRAVDFIHCNLEGANFKGADLTRYSTAVTTFEDSNLRHVDFWGANLSNTFLKKCDLRGTTGRGVRLDQTAITDCQTTDPDWILRSNPPMHH